MAIRFWFKITTVSILYLLYGLVYYLTFKWSFRPMAVFYRIYIIYYMTTVAYRWQEVVIGNYIFVQDDYRFNIMSFDGLLNYLTIK